MYPIKIVGGGREVPPELDAPYFFVDLVEPRNGKKLPDKYLSV